MIEKNKNGQAASVFAFVTIGVSPEDFPHPAAGIEAISASLRANLSGIKEQVRIRSIGDITVSTPTGNPLNPWQEETWSQGKILKPRKATIRETNDTTTPWSIIISDENDTQRLLGNFPTEDTANMLCELWLAGLLPVIMEDLPIIE